VYNNTAVSASWSNYLAAYYTQNLTCDVKVTDKRSRVRDSPATADFGYRQVTHTLCDSVSEHAL